MLLKDLNIAIKDHGVFCMANVIIKREEKFYSVLINVANETKHIEGMSIPTIEFINECIISFMDLCQKTDQNWIVDRALQAESSGDIGRQIMEFEIEL